MFNPRILMAVFFSLFTATAMAESSLEPIGYVKNVDGEAFVITNDHAALAQPSTPIYAGSLLKTSTDGSMGVIFKDETIMSFGPDTQLRVDDYLYKPDTGKLKLAGSLARGSLNYLSGVIARLRPEAVTIKTPTGTIGVRGTHFVAKVDPI